jgi:hypothetical protein
LPSACLRPDNSVIWNPDNTMTSGHDSGNRHLTLCWKINTLIEANKRELYFPLADDEFRNPDKTANLDSR